VVLVVVVVVGREEAGADRRRGSMKASRLYSREKEEDGPRERLMRRSEERLTGELPMRAWLNEREMGWFALFFFVVVVVVVVVVLLVLWADVARSSSIVCRWCGLIESDWDLYNGKIDLDGGGKHIPVKICCFRCVCRGAADLSLLRSK
jgi:hypothetical protein